MEMNTFEISMIIIGLGILTLLGCIWNELRSMAMDISLMNSNFKE